jgi:hypothetical protein
MTYPGIASFLSACLFLAGCGAVDSTSATSSGNQGQAGTNPPLGSSTPQSCTPLVGQEVPIQLGTVLGAGRDAAGTVYVLDDGADNYRAFVSQGDALWRKHVSGSGSTPSEIVATVDDPSAPLTIKIELSGKQVQGMSVFRGELIDKTFGDGAPGSESLSLVGTDVLANYAVKNIAPKVVVEYDATIPDGHRMLVTRPEVDWKYEDVRIFYGTPDRMVERKLVKASRGSSTYLTFAMDGAEYDAFFPSPLSPPGPAKITSPTGEITELTVATEAASASTRDSLTFVCRIEND